jgi:hypothetical protein
MIKLQEGEVIKKIDGYEKYYVSNYGRIFSTKYKKPRELKPSLVHGYPAVSLCQNCKSKKVAVHIYVAKAFIDNPNNLESVDHKDGNRTNNHASNLQWMSLSDNTTKELKDLGRHKLNKSDVLWIRKHYKKGDREFGAKPLARRFGIDNHAIRKAIKGTHYKWVTGGDAYAYNQT